MAIQAAASATAAELCGRARCGLLGDFWEVEFEAAGGFGLGREKCSRVRPTACLGRRVDCDIDGMFAGLLW